MDMTTTTEIITLPATPKDASSEEMRDLRYNLYRCGFLKSWKELRENDPEKFFEECLGLSGKEGYIAFRDHLKALINAMAAGQKPLKAAMHQRGGCSSSQERKDANASAITLLIEVRRAGKLWSAAQAKRNS
jgi:hypothetical protein